MTIYKVLSTLPILMIVAACAQPEPTPAPIYPEPIYDKYGHDISGGGGGCTGGQTAGASANCIPVQEQTKTTGDIPPLTKAIEPEGGADSGGGAGTGQ